MATWGSQWGIIRRTRIFERERGEYGLLVLRNPLNDPTGKDETFEINVRQASNTERFTLTFEPEATPEVPDGVAARGTTS